jgi:predicted transcriptional regulator
VKPVVQTQPTNEQIVKLLESVLQELSELKAELVKLAKVA